MAWNVTPGVIDDRATRAFLYGACGALAIAIHEATTWPIIAIGSCDGLDMHYMNRHPNGDLLDIRGTHTDTDIADEYEFIADNGTVTITETTQAHVWAWYQGEEGEPIPMPIVRSIAQTLLDQHAPGTTVAGPTINHMPLDQALTLMSPDTEHGTDVADTLDDKRRSEHYPRLLEEIRQYGITVPLHIDTDGGPWELLDGHHRVAAASDLGLATVPWFSARLDPA